MAIRVTQQFVQYVADVGTESDLRVTRLFAQVGVKLGVQQASNSLGFTPAVAQSGGFVDTVTNTLFGDVGDNDAVYDPIFNVFVGQSLGLSDEAEALYRAVSQTMLVSTASPDSYQVITQYLGFTDRKFHDTGNFIGFAGEASEAAAVSAANFIFANPNDDNVAVRAYLASDSFGFMETVTPFSDQVASNTFSLADAVTFSGPIGRDHSEGNLLRQSVSFTVSDNACREKEFAPLIGSSDDDSFDEMLVTAPTLTPTNGIVLEYPTTSPTHTLNLEPPDFGNDDVWDFTRIDRPTRGGDRKIFSDPKWAKWERLTLQLSGNTADCNASLDEILDFLNESLGKQIKLTDWEGRSWFGLIVAPETEVTETATGFALQLVFEGELATLEVQYGLLDVIHGQDAAGDVEVIYNL